MRVFSPASTINFSGRSPMVMRSGKSFDVDALLWKAAVVAAGGTVTDARLALVSTLIGSLKANGVWTLLDRLWLLAAENSQSALIDLVARATATAVNSPTFTTDRGYAGNATTSYVDTNYTPSVNAVALSLNSAHLSFYANTASAQLLATAGIGGNSGLHVFGPFSDGKMYARINNNDAGGGQGTGLAQIGLWIGDRTGAATVLNYRNGTLIGTDTTASTGISAAGSARVGARGGSNDQFNNARYAMCSVGGSLGASGDVAFTNAVTNFLTAIGAN